MQATNFSLPDQNNTIHTLSEYQGKWVVLYFYPKDDTPGCTKEACNFRDSFHELTTMGVVILGVSKDSVASHKKFAEKYNLIFPLLSDPDKKILMAYHAWGEKQFMGKTYDGTFRKTFLIGPQGEIVKEYPKVNPILHAKEIIEDLQRIQST